jgi:hypothetical protein
MVNATELYNLVKIHFYEDKKYNLYLTGSSALRLILQVAGFSDILATLTEPNDVDFLYTGTKTEIFEKRIICDFSNLMQPCKSATFSNREAESFDLTLVPFVKSIAINGILVIDPESLLEYYKADNDGADPSTQQSIDRYVKISALLEAITRIYASNDLFDRLIYVNPQKSKCTVDYGSTVRELFG